jgi:hypothetical protein
VVDPVGPKRLLERAGHVLLPDDLREGLRPVPAVEGQRHVPTLARRADAVAGRLGVVDHGRPGQRAMRRCCGAATCSRSHSVAAAAFMGRLTDLHRFFGQAGTLPNQPTGLTPDLLVDAQNGGTKVFPQVTGTLAAEQVMTLCSQVFTPPTGVLATSGQDLPATHVLTFQTWDPSRPTFEVLTSEEQVSELAAARAAHVGYADSWQGAAAWTGDVWQAVAAGLATISDISLDIVHSVATVTLTYVRETVSLVFDAVYETAQAAARVVEAILRAAGAAIADVLSWLRWALDLTDAFATKDALLSGAKQWSAYMSYGINYLFGQMGPNFFATTLSGAADDVAAAATAVDGTTFAPDPAGLGPAPGSGVPDLTTNPSPLDNPHGSWLLDQLLTPSIASGISLAPPETVPPPFTAAMAAFDTFVTAVSDTTVIGPLRTAMDALGQQLETLFDPTDPNSLWHAGPSALLGFVDADLLGAVGVFADSVVRAVQDLIIAVLACIEAVLALPLADSPVLTSLWGFITTQAAVPYATPTVGDFFGLATAFPLTVLMKAITGQVPFPGGFPVLPTPPGADRAPRAESTWFPDDAQHYLPGEYDINAEQQLMVQMAVGLSTAMFSGIDAYMDVHPFHDDYLKMLGWTQTYEDRVVWAMVIFDLLAFGVCDAPCYWGTDLVQHCPPCAESPEWAWWGEYFAKLPIYVGDVLCTFVLTFCGRFKHPKLFAHSLQDEVGNYFIAALGVLEGAFSCFLYIKEQGNKGSKTPLFWLVTQLVGLASSLTAPVRELPLPAYTPIWKLKLGVDVACDLASGAAWMWSGLRRPVIECQGLPQDVGPTVLPAATAGQLYSVELQAASGSFPPYGWTIIGDIPEELQWRADSAGYSQVSLVGKPSQAPMDYRFTVVLADSYDPNHVAYRDFTLHVAP